MKKPGSVKSLEDLGRVRLSKSFFMRDMLYSEIANFNGIPNIPDDPDLAIYAASKLCETLLEPLQEQFGRISIRSAYRAPAVNQFGNENNLGCARNEANYAKHIFDRRDTDGCCGATATIVVNSFIGYYEQSHHWQAMAWWIHDHLPPTDLYFFPKFAAFNITWHEKPGRTIQSYAKPKGTLTKPGMDNFEGSHAHEYEAFLATLCS
ncbi:peptidase M15 [uncultured Cohaesibacter sp.]|uniref:peptidase M15 n=1 Tax=uncultured Cohaesibacter sp. TaxID=1002546 RepID=UPI002AAB33FC|nr:peptidase M15 [uncultured Cohaesibacter sp.]